MTAPSIPPPTVENSRSFYTLGQMRAHHRAWVAYAKTLDIVEDEPAAPERPAKPQDPGVAALFKAFGMKA